MDKFTYKMVAGVPHIRLDGEDGALVIQPTWADGTAWATGEAAKWAKALILQMKDPSAPLAGDSPDSPTKPRPEPIPPIWESNPELFTQEQIDQILATQAEQAA